VPILHTQLMGQGKTPDGKTINIHPAQALQRSGPIVQVSVTLAQSFAATVAQSGGQLPQPVTGLALVDTGASNTCIDDEAAKSMNLPVIDVGSMHSASHAKTPSNIYPVQVEIIGFQIQFQSLRTMGAALKAQGLLMLLGRDLLQRCTLFYNGLTGQITLSI
jgi:predicted aspartyl protease